MHLCSAGDVPFSFFGKGYWTIGSFQSLICVWLFMTPWSTARQASLSITISRSPPKPISIESVMPSNHLILCHPLLLLPSASGSFQMSQLFVSGGQSIGVSASTSVPTMNTQDWSPLGWTGWISLQSKGLSRVFSNTTVVVCISKLTCTSCFPSLLSQWERVSPFVSA